MELTHTQKACVPGREARGLGTFCPVAWSARADFSLGLSLTTRRRDEERKVFRNLLLLTEQILGTKRITKEEEQGPG